ncbi:hypothetical protein BKA66DRAFT_564486 [Pyrenochaeta sp. MPI-SDFR-AT-0127]|nr:hypothetical protein BKA66DRAFT_564486 [Pyrenochaeta sp. MPI-SDFR-AT-0127]
MPHSEKYGLRWPMLADKRKNKPHHRQGWYPPGLRWWNLALAILICWTFIAILQYYLQKSQSSGGVIFATKINDLPLNRSFWYRYLPTIIAVIFSVFITWIDHDAKRYEPYRHMSRSGGALATDSILLHYPFEFPPFASIIAAKRRHWLIFCASFASSLTTFAILPLQAGIFSTRPIIRQFPQDFNVSENFIHSSIQEQALTLSYAQSAYGILKLNETLPAFTTRNYTLKPFTASGRMPSTEDSWTANSILYSMNLRCEKGQATGPTNDTLVVEETKYYASPNGGVPTAVQENVTHILTSDGGFNSSAGCYMAERELNDKIDGSQIFVNSKPVPRTYKKYSASYTGYFAESFVTGSISGNLRDSPQCGALGNRTFYATFTQNKKTEHDPDTEVTAIFCRPFYYEQEAQATVDAMTAHLRNITLIGTKRQISADVFNATVFEDTLASGERQLQIREDSLPVTTLPRCLENLYNSDLTPPVFAAPPIMTTVMSESTHRFQELLDPEKLGEAYELVYQLLFARAMADVLKPNFSAAVSMGPGLRQTQMEAVVLEPIFVYLVEGFLGLVSVAAFALIYIGYSERRNGKLADDPASLAGIMSMVADDKGLLEKFRDLDCASVQYFNQKLSTSRYKLGNDVFDHCMTTVKLNSDSQQSPLITTGLEEPERHRLSKPMRPTEFRLAFAVPFTSLFVSLMITLAVLFSISRPHGLALPSKNRVVQNLLTDYLPTAIAALIEPMWIMINRLICVMQPLEQMQGTGASASRSINLNYSSLPPQLTLFKAARSGHFLLAAVCGMSLLANLLATAFAGLFFRATLPLSHSTLLSPPFEPKFVSINGSSGPPISTSQFYGNSMKASGAYQESTGENHFLLAESNLTRNTSLPSWTDENAMYLPFKDSRSPALHAESTYQAHTKYFTAEPRCRPLSFDKDYHMHLWPIATEDWLSSFNVTVSSSDGSQTTCYGTDHNEFIDNYGYKSHVRAEGSGGMSCRNGKTAAEMVTTLKPGPNATAEEGKICKTAVVIGWIRTTQRYCDLPSPKDPKASYLEGFEDAASNNTFFMLCQPEIRIGDATVVVDSAGVLQKRATDRTAEQDQTPQALDKYFSNGIADVISQSNLFIFRTLKPWWHNDTFASEFMHYFINRAEGSLRLTDPNKPLPTFADVEEPMKKAYTRLFAIWLGVNKELLFLPATDTTKQVLGSTITPEERILFVTPLFVISEIVLAIYIIVSLVVYLRRPGRYLTRAPTSIAAIIALFASSAAVKDLRGTSSMKNKEREKYLKDLDCCYGYGSYVGDDGRVHVGVEKVPFVIYMEELSFVGNETRKRNVKGSSALLTTTTE